jgi:hypothetical protein
MADSTNTTTSDTTKSAFVFYHYNPSMVAAVIFILLFLVSTIYHLFLIFKARTWYFIPFTIGCICKLLSLSVLSWRQYGGGYSRRKHLTWEICLVETIGYVGRAMSAKEAPNFTKNPYIIQSMLLLLGPTLFAASIYMILGRLIRLLDAGSLSIIRPNWLTKVFVLGDLLSFFAQSGGEISLARANLPCLPRCPSRCGNTRAEREGDKRWLTTESFSPIQEAP